MAMAIAIAIGIREQSILASIFMLHWVTMMMGLLTEYVSVPRSRPDRNTYALPVGAEQFHQWQRLNEPVEAEENGEPPNPNDAARNPRFRVDYHRDPRALKLISQDAWEVPRRANAAPDARSRPARRAGRPSLLGRRVLEPAQEKGRGRRRGRRARQLLHRGAALPELHAVSRSAPARAFAAQDHAARWQAHVPAHHRLLPDVRRLGDHRRAL